MWAAPVYAQSDLDRCNDVLEQDLFNKTTSSVSSSASEQQTYTEWVFNLEADEAYEEYETAYTNRKTQGTTGNAEGHYGLIGGALAFTHDYDRLLEGEEFSTKFDEAKAEYRKNIGSSSSKASSLISVHTSTVRDATTIRAWERCMTTRYEAPGLFAYGYRDESGNPYVVVLWAPGTFAVTAPVINVRFGTDPDITIEGGPNAQIGTGSGASFPVRFTSGSDRRAKSDGFAVLVNGELKQGDQLLQSFRSEAIVPRNLGPLPCSNVFAVNKSYEFGVLNEESNTIQWGYTELSTAGSEFTAADGTSMYEVRLTVKNIDPPSSGSGHLKLTGTDFSISFEGSPGFITGECTGQGVRGVMAETGPPICDEEGFCVPPATFHIRRLR